jgi:hypothetical protein
MAQSIHKQLKLSKTRMPKADIHAVFEDVSAEELDKALADSVERKTHKSELARRLLALEVGRSFRVNSEKRLIQARYPGSRKIMRVISLACLGWTAGRMS